MLGAGERYTVPNPLFTRLGAGGFNPGATNDPVSGVADNGQPIRYLSRRR